MPLPYTPIYDRVVSDLVNKTAKGYFNIADASRIYDNFLELHDLVLSLFGYNVPYYDDPTYGISYVLDIDRLNAFPGNIEAVRAYLFSVNPDIVDAPGIVELKDDYIAGPHEIAPNFRNVNDWERVTYLLYTILSTYTVTRKPRAGVGVCGADMTKSNMFRSY